MKLLTPQFFDHFLLLFLLGLAQKWFKYHFVKSLGPYVMHDIIPLKYMYIPHLFPTETVLLLYIIVYTDKHIAHMTMDLHNIIKD